MPTAEVRFEYLRHEHFVIEIHIAGRVIYEHAIYSASGVCAAAASCSTSRSSVLDPIIRSYTCVRGVSDYSSLKSCDDWLLQCTA